MWCSLVSQSIQLRTQRMFAFSASYEWSAYLLAGLVLKRAGNAVVVEVTCLLPPLAAIVLNYWTSDVDVY